MGSVPDSLELFPQFAVSELNISVSQLTKTVQVSCLAPFTYVSD